MGKLEYTKKPSVYVVSEDYNLFEPKEVTKYLTDLYMNGDDEKIRTFIENCLDKDSKKMRFDMSGISNVPGECHIHNQNVLNTFAPLGFYEHFNFVVLTFNKGSVTLNYELTHNPIYETTLPMNLGGYSTADIIIKIFELSIFTE